MLLLISSLNTYSFTMFSDCLKETKMRKIYLEKRSTDDCDSNDSIDTIDTIDTFDELNDIDMFLHRELENYNNYTTEFFTQDLNIIHLEVGNSSLSEGRASVIRSSKDHLETQLTQCPSTSAPRDNSFDGFDIQQISEHSSSDLDPSSLYFLENTSSTYNDQEPSPNTPSTSTLPVNISDHVIAHSSSPSTSSSSSSKKLKSKFQSSVTGRKVFPCEHSGCGKKYTKLSHLKVSFFLFVNKYFNKCSSPSGPHVFTHWREALQLPLA